MHDDDAHKKEEEEEGPAYASGMVYRTRERMVIYLGLTWREHQGVARSSLYIT